jgi:hypothetical protein
LATPENCPEIFSPRWRILSRPASSPNGKKALLSGWVILQPATPPDTKAGQTVRDDAGETAARPAFKILPKKESDESEGDTQPQIRDQKD